MSTKPHQSCPNYVDEFPLDKRGKPCVTCQDLGQVPGCIGAAHPRRQVYYLRSLMFVRERNEYWITLVQNLSGNLGLLAAILYWYYYFSPRTEFKSFWHFLSVHIGENKSTDWWVPALSTGVGIVYGNSQLPPIYSLTKAQTVMYFLLSLIFVTLFATIPVDTFILIFCLCPGRQ